MGTELRNITVLVQYDVPELFVGQDIIGRQFISLLVEDDEKLKYLAVPISKNRLEKFLSGDIDLRTVFELPETSEYYQVSFNDDNNIIVQFWSTEIPNKGYLPDEGFSFDLDLIDDIQTDSYVKQKGIVQLTLKNHEEPEEFVVNANRLVSHLGIFQKLLERSYKKTISLINPSNKKELLSQDFSTLQVYGFAEGSFKVKLQTKKNIDVVGNSFIDQAFKALDQIVQNYDDQELLQSILIDYKGHFVSSLREFVETIINENEPIEYKWFSPSLEKPIVKSINIEVANEIHNFLKARNELETEEAIFEGVFVKADVQNGSWKLYNEENNEYILGKSDERTKSSLSGITLDTVLYKIYCHEEVFEVLSSGEEKHEYYLIDFENINEM